MGSVTPQIAALNTTRTYAHSRQELARDKIAHVLRMSGIAQTDFESAVQAIRDHSRVALHFHPDRIDASGHTVAESLLEDGIYKSQFETGLSNGKLAPRLGGSRDLWENNLFGDAYGAEVPLSHRPKYGALNLMLLPDGPSPRFGSCYLLLKPDSLEHCTFTYMDSHLEPIERGTIDVFDDILASLLLDSLEREFSIGVPGMRPPALIEHLSKNLPRIIKDPANESPARNLDFYIEAQRHGPVILNVDADILVTDPSFDGSHTGATLERTASKFNLSQFRHCGFTLRDKDVPSDFRGTTMPSLASRISENGMINARIIGDAARDAMQHPQNWSDRGALQDNLQELKMLWHCLVRFGEPET